MKSINCDCYNFYFFFRQKTAYALPISDWSSEVCSSDPLPIAGDAVGRLVESFVKSVGAGICQASVIERGREIGVYQIAPKGPELIGFTRLEPFAQIVNASDE